MPDLFDTTMAREEISCTSPIACGVCLDGNAPCPVVDPPNTTQWTCLACGRFVGQKASTREISFDVLGTPAPKGSVRPIVVKGRAMLTPSSGATGQRKLKSWDANVRDAARAVVGETETPPFVDTALCVTIEFRMTRPSGHWGTGRHAGTLKPSAPSVPRGKPDIDKLARATLDALTGTVIDDDSRIATLTLRKVYARPGHEGATISIREA